MVYWGTAILCFAWLLDGGPTKFHQILKEPLAVGILVFCSAWLIGLLWSDLSIALQGKWKKYFILLIFIPFYSLLNKERLPWTIGGLLIGYVAMVGLGCYQWLIEGKQGDGIPLLHMNYLSFSSALGIGSICAVFIATLPALKNEKSLRIMLWTAACLLLFIQFNQSARGLLISTITTLLIIIALRYREQWKILVSGLLSFSVIAILFAANSTVFQERLQQTITDLQAFQQGNYMTSPGYRLAMWDVGLHGIIEHPLLGQGTGMAGQYFEKEITTYKHGVYQDLPAFQETKHFHNELIDIGMNLGLLGISAFLFLLGCWLRTFKQHHLLLAGCTTSYFIVMSGMTDTFLLYSRIPLFLLIITAIGISWQQFKNGER